MAGSRPRSTLLTGLAAATAVAAIAVAGATVGASGDDGHRSDGHRDSDGHTSPHHGTSQRWPWPSHGDPFVVGHRGASGYRPEHTLASYELAIQQGADFVEPDLVSTKDGVLVARHENEISGTTDVADHPEFADRYTTKTIDGVEISGWFTEDFTLAELKTLRAVERLPDVRPTNATFDGQFEIPTFDEVLELLAEVNADRRPHERIGVYPETKHPTYFDSIGLSLEEPLVEALDAHGLDHRWSPVHIQSFEISNLHDLDEMTDAPIVQLVSAAGAPYDAVAAGDETTYADMVTPGGLAEVATYAEGLGAEKALIIPVDDNDALLEPTSLIDDAHDAGLTVTPWTVRAENQFMAADFRNGADPNARGRVEDELNLLFDLGVDGVFTDNPDIAVAVLAGRS